MKNLNNSKTFYLFYTVLWCKFLKSDFVSVVMGGLYSKIKKLPFQNNKALHANARLYLFKGSVNYFTVAMCLINSTTFAE
jgi:hypothetical protein